MTKKKEISEIEKPEKIKTEYRKLKGLKILGEKID